MASLGVAARRTIEPKATEHIPEMIALIERLIANGVAYPVDGDVYFEVRRFPAYGALSGKNLEELRGGRPRRRGRAQARPARLRALEGGEARRARRGRARGGRAGRAGTSSARPWRCSYLGETLRHPRRRRGPRSSRTTRTRSPSPRRRPAQPFVRYWLHNGFVNLGAEKMSKSLGNTLTIRDMVRAPRPRGASPLPPRDALPPSARVQRRAHRRGRRGRSDGSRALKAEAERIAAKRDARRPDPTAGCFDEVGGPARPVRGGDGRRLQHAPGARGALRPGPGPQRGARPGGAGRGGRRAPFSWAWRELLDAGRVLGLLEGAARERAPVDAAAQGAGRVPRLSAPGGAAAARLCRGRPPSRRADRDWASSSRTRRPGRPGSSGEASRRPSRSIWPGATRAGAAAGGQPARGGDRHPGRGARARRSRTS